MKVKMYSIFDQAASAYITPFFMLNDGLAVRAFQDNVNSREENNISKHPDQFTLFALGEFDDKKGELIEYDKPRSLGNGLTFKDNADETMTLQEVYRLVDSIFEGIKTVMKD